MCFLINPGIKSYGLSAIPESAPELLKQLVDVFFKKLQC